VEHQVNLFMGSDYNIELLFRAWKHTLGALHLLNLSEHGIALQFQVLLLASLLSGSIHSPLS
jgi:hypothetical protein